MGKLKIKKGDKVLIMYGKERGKKGKVLSSLPLRERVIVEGVNFLKKHTKPSQKNPQGGIIQKEGSVHVSNVMLICPRCNQAARIGYRESKGNKIRYCKKCESELD